ncbi:MAG: 16S rRNA (guanine(966)-N(2))-methyltransferase RsmD [Clostridia bacterium]|nr:16S rRNA (guanine(966)-N(2))-methyltransferase RsmD [Clostridia bacterium]
MRVISGTAKGKKLNSLQGFETRPTLDRVKESIFNVIQFSLNNSIILDLFAGSGALGIEALSRGAKEAVFCDNSNKATQIIKKNLEETRLIEKAKIINKNYIQALKQLKEENKRFDIIFLDPPYKSDYIIKSIKYILEYNLLKQDGIIIVETNEKNKIKEIEENKELIVYDTRKYGIAVIIFVRKG